MVNIKGSWRGVALCMGAFLVTAAAAGSESISKLPALAGLEPGLWQIREIGNTQAVPQSICVTDPAIFMQIQHRQSSCTSTVVQKDERSATVHYTCPSNGFGHTTIRTETPRLAKIDTQGILSGIPFAYRAEARRIGDCDPGKTASR